LAATVSIGLAACSVYDDTLLRAGSTPDATLVRPPMSGAMAQASAGRAASSVTTPPGAVAADGGSAPCVKSAALDYCAQLPALTHPPQIDGIVECGLTLAPVKPVGVRGLTDAPNQSASYAAAWSPQGLYVYVEVHGSAAAPHPPDQPIFCGDAVELFVDSDAKFDDTGAYKTNGTMQFVVAAPAPGAAGAMDAQRFVQGKPQGAWVTPALRVSARSDGYSVEALIGGADLGLWQWSPMTQLGFSIGRRRSEPIGVRRTSRPILLARNRRPR
jgi:hypothetical protein